MPLSPLTEQALRDALHSLRPDPESFAQGVLDRVEEADANDTPTHHARSPLVHVAAGVLPLSLLGGKLLATGATSGSVSWAYRLLGYAALPAVSIFLVLGAFLLGAWSVLRRRGAQASAEAPNRDEVAAWWRRHWPLAALIYAALPVLMFFGTETVFFVLILGSFVALAMLLAALSRVGLARRAQIASFCTQGLFLLAMPMQFGIATSRGGLVDSSLSSTALIVGAVVVALVGNAWHGEESGRARRWGIAVMASILLLLSGGGALLRAATPASAQRFVESFDAAAFRSASWRKWEAPALWLRETGRDVSWSEPRALLERTEGRGDPNPYVLGIASRAGLIGGAELRASPGFASRREALLRELPPGPAPIGFLEQHAWVIEGIVLDDRPNQIERERLAARLQDTWEALHERDHERLHEALLLTELTAKLGVPIDVEARRRDVFAWLGQAYDVLPDGDAPDGGFAARANGPTDDRATWSAVGLMEHYGVPPAIDLLRVRLSARPKSNLLTGPSWTRAATRWKVDALRGHRPTLGEYMAHERTLVACILLVLLVLFATLRAPRGADDSE